MKFGMKMGFLAVAASFAGACASGGGTTGGAPVGVQPVQPAQQAATRTLMAAPDAPDIAQTIASLPERISFADAKRMLVPFPGTAGDVGAKPYTLQQITPGQAHMRQLAAGIITNFNIASWSPLGWGSGLGYGGLGGGYGLGLGAGLGLGRGYLGGAASSFYGSGIYQPMTNFANNFMYAARGENLFPYYATGGGYSAYRGVFDSGYNALVAPFYRFTGQVPIAWGYAILPSAKIEAADNVVLNIRNNAIDQSDVALRAGGTVSFINRDAVPRMIADSGALASGMLQPGAATQPMVLNTAGSYGYGGFRGGLSAGSLSVVR